MLETITPPVSLALEHIIERPRLIERLAEGGGSRVSMLAAAAGYGKTTLARQWSERQTGPVPWYRTTKASGDVALLAVQLDALLETVAPELPRQQPSVASIASVNPSPDPLGRAIIRRFEPLTQDVLLVVDEWEAAGTEEAETLLSMLVDGLDIRFLVTTRERPDWFTPKLKMYGEGLEIGMEELAMTDQEATDVLFYVRDQEASADVRALADGWPAVLGLAAMHARAGAQTDASNLLPDTLYEYLASELIDAAEPAVQEAVTLIALTSAQDVETARLLLEPGADALLAAAEASGLLTADSAGRIAIHPLLRRMLLDRLANARAPFERLDVALRRILEHHLWNEAQAVADVLPRPAFVSQALEHALPDLLHGGRLTTIRKWIEIGREANTPAGLLDYAESELSLRNGNTLRALGLAVQATQSLEGELAARAHVVAGRAAHLSDRPDATEEHADAAAAVGGSPETLEDAEWLRFLSALDRQVSDLRQRFEEFKRVTRPGIRQSLVVATGELCLAELLGGIGPALDRARSVLASAQDRAPAMAHTGLLSSYSYGLAITGRYAESLSTSDRLVEVAETCSLAFPLAYAKLNKARAAIGLRHFTTADRLLRSLERDTRNEPGSYFRHNIAIQRARFHASTGDVQRAIDVLSLGPSDEAIVAERGEFFAWQALLYSAVEEEESSRLLAVEALATSCGIEVKSLALTARAIDAARRHKTKALAHFDEAVATEIWDPIVIAVRVVPQLGACVASSFRRRTWLQRLLTQSGDTSLAASIGLSIPRDARPKRVLSAREQEVHELLAQGLTNEQIAKQLYISLSTTKVHVKHIFEKLGVRSRLEAARAFIDEDTTD